MADSLLPKNNGKTTGYRQNRFRIANLDFRGRKSPILVLDEIAKLTPPKLELIRYLAMAKRFQFVAVVENFLKADQLSLPRGWLHPALLLDIGYLGEQPAREFFRYYSRKNHFCWTEGEINNLAEMSGGYPLGMKEIVMRRLEREESREFSAGLPGVDYPQSEERLQREERPVAWSADPGSGTKRARTARSKKVFAQSIEPYDFIQSDPQSGLKGNPQAEGSGSRKRQADNR